MEKPLLQGAATVLSSAKQVPRLNSSRGTSWSYSQQKLPSSRMAPDSSTCGSCFGLPLVTTLPAVSSNVALWSGFRAMMPSWKPLSLFFLNLSRLQYKTEKMRDGAEVSVEAGAAAAGVGLWKVGADVPAPAAVLDAGRTNSRGFLAAPASGTTGAVFSFPVCVLVLVVAASLDGRPGGRVVCCWLLVLAAGIEGCWWCVVAVAVADVNALGCRGAEKRRLYIVLLLFGRALHLAEGSTTCGVWHTTAGAKTRHVAPSAVKGRDGEGHCSLCSIKIRKSPKNLIRSSQNPGKKCRGSQKEPGRRHTKNELSPWRCSRSTGAWAPRRRSAGVTAPRC